MGQHGAAHRSQRRSRDRAPPEAAAQHGRSAEAEHRAILERPLGSGADDFWAKAARLRAHSRPAAYRQRRSDSRGSRSARRAQRMIDAAVLDVSVAVKWVVGEPGEHAAARLATRSLPAPDILLAEWASALWARCAGARSTRTRPRPLSPHSATRACGDDGGPDYGGRCVAFGLPAGSPDLRLPISRAKRTNSHSAGDSRYPVHGRCPAARRARGSCDAAGRSGLIARRGTERGWPSAKKCG
jgi:hypothetical protein